MKLPEIETAPVQDTSSAQLKLSADAQQFSDVVGKGFAAISQEITRTETQRAAVKFSAGLTEAEQKIDSQTSLSTQELRDMLGPDFDKIDPAIKNRITQKNPITGQEEDRKDIPMWQVAGAIYDAHARRAMASATQEIGSSGWQADFQDKAAAEIEQRKRGIVVKQMHQMVEDLSARHVRDALDAFSNGDPELGQSIVSSSRVMDEKLKLKVLEEGKKIEESKPIFDADRTDDYGKMAELIGQLNDPAKFTSLDPKERAAYSDKLKARIKEFTASARTEQERREKAYDNAVAMGVYQASVSGQPLSAKMLPLDMHDPEKYKSLADYIEKKNKGEEIKTNWPTYAALYEQIRTGKDVDLTSYLNRLAGTEFKQLLEMQLGRKQSGAGYDQFQTTDEAINAQLRAIPGAPDPANGKDEKNMAKVGYLKSVIQHELAAAQRGKANQAPLGLEERDAVITSTIKREVDPKKGFFSSTTIPTYTLGMPAQIVPTFRRAVVALAPVLGFKDPNSEQTLETAYADYKVYEPHIDVAWQVQRGANVLPQDSVRVWYYLNANMARLKGRLIQTGGGTDDKALLQKRLVQMAVQEISR